MKEKMKKETIYKVTSVLILSLPLIAFAQIQSVTATAEDMVGGIFKLLGSAASLIAVVFIALGLFKFATSAGDERAMGEAKQNLIWGVVGMIVGVAMLNGIDILKNWFGVSFT